MALNCNKPIIMGVAWAKASCCFLSLLFQKLSCVSGRVGSRVGDLLPNGFLFVKDSDSGGRGSHIGDEGGGGGVRSMRVVVRGGGGVTITLGGRLASTMAAAPDVKVRVGVCVGDSSPAVVEEFGGGGGLATGLW
jgi:hypothetical protein